MIALQSRTKMQRRYGTQEAKATSLAGLIDMSARLTPMLSTGEHAGADLRPPQGPVTVAHPTSITARGRDAVQHRP